MGRIGSSSAMAFAMSLVSCLEWLVLAWSGGGGNGSGDSDGDGDGDWGMQHRHPKMPITALAVNVRSDAEEKCVG
jgi:hypothetical protein